MVVLKKIPAGLVVALSLPVNAYLLAYALMWNRWAWLDPVTQVAPWLLGFSLLCGLVALLLSRWVGRWWWVLYLPALAVFLLWYGGNIFGRRSSVQATGPTFTVATFNVFGYIADPDQTFAVVQAMDADLVGFQELRPTLEGKLQTELAEEYPYQVSKVVQGFDGLALISRYPILESQIVLDELEVVDLVEPRYLRAVVEVDGQPMVVYVYHATAPSFDLLTRFDDDWLQANSQAMAALVAKETLPTLLLCDCNTGPRTRAYRTFDRYLDDSFAQTGRGFGLTHPSGDYGLEVYHSSILGFDPKTRLIRIDYIWHSSQLIAMDSQTWPSSGTSDHHPVRATLALLSTP